MAMCISDYDMEHVLILIWKVARYIVRVGVVFGLWKWVGGVL